MGHFVHVGLTVTVGVVLGQHFPAQPTVTSFKIMQSGCGPMQFSSGQVGFTAGLVFVTVGQAGVVTVVTGHLAGASGVATRASGIERARGRLWGC